MNGRRHGSKTTIALWMLIAVADLAILVAATGALTLLLVVTGLVALVGGAVALTTVWQPVRETRPLLRKSANPAGAVARRRA